MESRCFDRYVAAAEIRSFLQMGVLGTCDFVRNISACGDLVAEN